MKPDIDDLFTRPPDPLAMPASYGNGCVAADALLSLLDWCHNHSGMLIICRGPDNLWAVSLQHINNEPAAISVNPTLSAALDAVAALAAASANAHGGIDERDQT